MEQYIDCNRCKIWKTHIIDQPCPDCNDTGKVADPQSILCNMCGESMCHNIVVPSGKWNPDKPHGLYKAQATGGYESYHLLDMNQYTFSFCEECLRKLFFQCKIKPDVHEMDFCINGTSPFVIEVAEMTYEKDLESYEYRVWKDGPGHHQAYLDKKCNSVKDCPNQAVYTLLHDHVEFTENTFCEDHKDRKYLNSTLVKFIPNVLKPFL